ALGTDAGGDRLAGRRLAARHHHPGPRFRQVLGDRLADAAAGAGDGGNLPLQVEQAPAVSSPGAASNLRLHPWRARAFLRPPPEVPCPFSNASAPSPTIRRRGSCSATSPPC